MLSHVSYSIHVFICVFMHVKLGSAELSASKKVGEETTNLFSPLEKSQRGIHWVLLLVFENAEHMAFIKHWFFGRRLSSQSSTRWNLALCNHENKDKIGWRGMYSIKETWHACRCDQAHCDGQNWKRHVCVQCACVYDMDRRKESELDENRGFFNG